MAKKPVAVAPDPKVVAAAMKRVMPLLKKFPKELQPAQAAITKSALGGLAVAHRKKSSEEIGGVVVFGGDVVIDGSFDIGCVCIVLGDLTVKDVIAASEYETYLVVGGSIRARGMICKGHIRAAGSIEAEVIFVETSTKVAAKRIATDLLVMEWSSDKVEGTVAAKKKIGLTYPDPKGLRQLERVLHPKAFGTVGGDAALFDYTNLEAVLRKRKPWRQ